MAKIDEKKANVKFFALDPYLETNIVSPAEKKGRAGGKDIIEWGDGNAYPDYILDLYANVVTFRSVVDGLTDYICGNGVALDFKDGNPNKKMTFPQIFRKLARSRAIYRGAALQVIRNNGGEIDSVWPVDMRYLRTNKDASVWYYSENFGKKFSRRVDMLEYPSFMKDGNSPTSILMIWDPIDGVYPEPWIAAAVKACETERDIDEYHLNSIRNGFSSSYFVNFNNGVPDDVIKEEIEKDFTEKFTGSKNAARVGFSWNPNKDAATTFEQIKQEDFGEKYQALARNTMQKIFTAYRANPNLFGIPTENLGFSQEEYDAAFRLFNRTMVVPEQRVLKDALETVFGSGSVSIAPFAMDTVSEE